MDKMTVDQIKASASINKAIIADVVGNWISPNGSVEIYAITDSGIVEVHMANGKADMIVDCQKIAGFVKQGILHK